MSETIVALATPNGKSGVAVIRVSGIDAFNLCNKLTGKIPEFRKATMSTIKNDKNEILDNCLVLTFKGPNSFTGEDIVEFHIHGGIATIKIVLEEIRKNNIRFALPGEFTKRAYNNGKLDLTQVEALSDLIHCETEIQRKISLSQMNGLITTKIDDYKKRLIQILAHYEASIDFSDEPLPEDIIIECKNKINKILEEIQFDIKNAKIGEKIKNGLKVAIIGEPNAGKSTLLNMLAKREAAIVSEYAGTTRDIIEIHMDIEGYSVTFFDTAGIRDCDNPIEKEGIRRSVLKAEESDILLLLCPGGEIAKELENYKEKSIKISSKSDIYDAPVGFIPIHNKENGLTQFMSILLSEIKEKYSYDDVHFTRERHIQSLEKINEYLNDSLNYDMPELVAEHLRLAVYELSRIVGKIDVEDLLDVIFSEFCIGK